MHARPSHSPPSYRPGKVDELETLKILKLGITLPYLGGTLALAGAVHAGAAATLLQLLALVQLGAVFRSVALPGLLHAVMFNTKAVLWVVSISYSL